MMNKYCLTILLTLCTFVCYAEIREIKDVKEIFNYLDKANAETLVIFDVDMVLIQPSDPAFQMANMKRFNSIAKRIMKEISPDKQAIFLSLMTINSNSILIDECAPLYLEQIIQKKIPVMAMTANLTGEFQGIKSMEKWRIEGLKQLGIDFSRSAPYQSRLLFDQLASYRGYYSTYLDGILFVNGTLVSKGEALLSFLEKIHFHPNQVIFIDDREENLKSVMASLQTLNPSIEYIGLHFIGAQTYPSKLISEEEFESRWQRLADEAKKIN